SPPPWTLGGGTVLMFRHQHRVSQDIDIFFSDAQYLTALSPRLNDDAAALTESYHEASTFLKLALSAGEIDFIVAPNLTGLAPEVITFEGHSIRADASAEILAKKLFYRTATLKVRDVLDLAVVLA